MRTRDHVRQALVRISRAGLEEQRSATVERQLKGDCDPLSPWAVEGGDRNGEGAQLSPAVLDREPAQRYLKGTARRRTMRIRDRPVQGVGNAAARSWPPQVIGPQLMDR
jgi:hypothetical protein